MSRVMEENFAYNLNLENYAELCHMSLSAFKKNFKRYYNTPPAAWLLQRKLALRFTSCLHQNERSVKFLLNQASKMYRTLSGCLSKNTILLHYNIASDI